MSPRPNVGIAIDPLLLRLGLLGSQKVSSFSRALSSQWLALFFLLSRPSAGAAWGNARSLRGLTVTDTPAPPPRITVLGKVWADHFLGTAQHALAIRRSRPQSRVTCRVTQPIRPPPSAFGQRLTSLAIPGANPRSHTLVVLPKENCLPASRGKDCPCSLLLGPSFPRPRLVAADGGILLLLLLPPAASSVPRPAAPL